MSEHRAEWVGVTEIGLVEALRARHRAVAVAQGAEVFAGGGGGAGWDVPVPSGAEEVLRRLSPAIPNRGMMAAWPQRRSALG
ncbi:hypothetical protein [Antrihabitans stalactiti]|uniref:Uncharacterized protein n=1 Tax=Antrihabitans stalactiti TaxID=2584121 RepID=A0A848KAQ6_9NOCA|nr:hypothetical protein [Antrihabitans stalactiti]NMN94766.1 hypothetical protein [Antrihabitans stalactiti]